MNSNLRGGILALVGALLFSTKAIFVKLAYQYDVDAASLLMLRMLFSLPVFLFVGFYSIRSVDQSFSVLNRYKWRIIFFGVLGYYLASFLDLEGLRFIDASLERIILFIYPTLVIIINLLVIKKRPSNKQVGAILVTYVGICITYLANLSVNNLSEVIRGGILVFSSAIAYSLYLVGTGTIGAKVGAALYNSFAMTAAAIAIIIHNSILHGFNLFSFQSEVYMYGILISIFSTIIPSYLIVESIRLIGSNRSSIIGSVGPISTILLAVVVLGEVLNFWQAVGSGVVIIGVLIVLLERSKKVIIN